MNTEKFQNRIPTSRLDSEMVAGIEQYEIEFDEMKQQQKLLDDMERAWKDREEDNSRFGAEEFLHKELTSASEYYEIHEDGKVDELYDWYAKAMRRREDREPLSKAAFIDHFFGDYDRPEKMCMFGDDDTGYLLGEIRFHVFIPSHFAPKTMKGGLRLMKSLGDSEIPSVLFVTDDLADMLKKIPEWKVENIQIPAIFRGQYVKKTVAHNHISDFVLKFQDVINKRDI
ncbi:MAG: hypothetical protein ABIH21_04250 [Patescibacteria group bacterium]